MRAFAVAVAAALVAITLSGCGTDTTTTAKPATTTAAPNGTTTTGPVTTTAAPNGTTTGPVTTTTAPMVTTTTVTTTTVDPLSLTVVQAAQADANLTELVKLLIQADLVGALSGAGPFTVFAPSNAAFAAVNSTVVGLSNTQLQQVLSYHVGDTLAATAAELTDGQSINTLFASHQLTVDKHSVPPTVILVGETNNVSVSTADVVCSNGVVHIVDGVLIPTLSFDVLIQA